MITGVYPMMPSRQLDYRSITRFSHPFMTLAYDLPKFQTLAAHTGQHMLSSDIDSIDAAQAALGRQEYVCDRRLSTSVFLALRLGRPLFVEGDPGVGKTELAKALSRVLDTELIRIQCYEGLDVSQTAYEWNVARQLLRIRLAEAAHRLQESGSERSLERDLYERDMLIERPLLRSLTRDRPPVLLIDELDRADEPFDAFLLEMLAEYQITIPELGTIKSSAPPIVVITSNRTREVHDALKRRCFYHWLGFPSRERELAIVERRVPEASRSLSRQAVAFVHRTRELDLLKQPGIAETIDWVNALEALNASRLDPETIEQTIGILLKHQDDIAQLEGLSAAKLIEEIHARGWLEDAH